VSDTGRPPRTSAAREGCILVAGMHRSGTSAVCRVINLLGAAVAHPDDLLGATPSNPRGHWESASLVRINDEALRLLGGFWWCPPAAREGQWETDGHRTLRPRAAEALRAAHPREPWVWKDPRLCLTLPFWRPLLPAPACVVLVLRDPSEIAASLAARDRGDTDRALMLWERSMHHLLPALQGLPVATVRYATLLADPDGTTATLRARLADAGIALDEPPPGAVAAFVSPALRNQHAAAGAELPLSGPQARLRAMLAELPDYQPAFVPPRLPGETPGNDRGFLELRTRALARRSRVVSGRAARIVMTLLVRDEADTVEANIRHHLAEGVSRVLVTDNRSTDGTREILAALASELPVSVIDEPADNYDQARWVTRMARAAAAEHGADWVINADADEFFRARQGTLAEALARIPGTYGLVVAQRQNHVPRPPSDLPFHARMIYRTRDSRNLLGEPLAPKVIHRASAEVVVGMGNHSVVRPRLTPYPQTPIVIHHFPLRTYAAFAAKIDTGGAALGRNSRLPAGSSHVWQEMRRRLETGELERTWAAQVYDDERIGEGLRSGELVLDREIAIRLARSD
jgi:hypothetical protein